jgi:hypothetical protein
MSYRRFIIVLFTLAFFGCGGTQNVTADGWTFIGDKWVSFGLDHDVIHTGNSSDAYRQLKVRVTSAPIRILDMKVYFDNGDVQDVPVRSLIPQGGETRVIDLDGGLRKLSKIEFWYETKGARKGKSRVAVWGRR